MHGMHRRLKILAEHLGEFITFVSMLLVVKDYARLGQARVAQESFVALKVPN